MEQTDIIALKNAAANFYTKSNEPYSMVSFAELSDTAFPMKKKEATLNGKVVSYVPNQKNVPNNRK